MTPLGAAGLIPGQPGSAMAAINPGAAAAAQSWQSLAAANSGYPMPPMMSHNPGGYQPNGQSSAAAMNSTYPAYPGYNSANTAAAAMASMSAATNPYLSYGAAGAGAYNYYGLNGAAASQPSPTGVSSAASPPISSAGSQSEARPPSIGEVTAHSTSHLGGAPTSALPGSSALTSSSSNASSSPTSAYGGSSSSSVSSAPPPPLPGSSSLASSLSQFSVPGQSSLPHHLPTVSHHNSIPSWTTPHYGAAPAGLADNHRTTPTSASALYDYGAELSKTSSALYGQGPLDMYGMAPNSSNPTLGAASHLPL